MTLDVISTGSKGNCYVLRDGEEALLLDAGLPITRITRGIKSYKGVVGCLVTHEHSDHAKSALEIVRRGVPVVCSAGTKAAIDVDGISQIQIVKSKEKVRLGRFVIAAFETQHDAADPMGFLIKNTRTNELILYATDTYYLRYKFPRVNYWIVECNYCEELLEEEIDEGVIGSGLRNRLKESHMSLRRLKDVLSANDLRNTWKIVLVHLSDTRSNEERMVSEIYELTGIETVAANDGMSIDLNEVPF